MSRTTAGQRARAQAPRRVGALLTESATIDLQALCLAATATAPEAALARRGTVEGEPCPWPRGQLWS